MDAIKLTYTVPGDDFTRAGEASSEAKKALKQLGLNPEIIRRVAIVMYEGEINMVIHANGGTVEVTIDKKSIHIVMTDTGKGIPDIAKAMEEGYSTAPDNVRSLGFGAGMGLPNMKKYSDEMTVESTVNVGTTVRSTIFIK